MAREHAPSQARALVASAKAGAPLAPLVESASALADPYHAAWALGRLAERADGATRSSAIQLACSRAARVPQGWRRAELVGELATQREAQREFLPGLKALVEGLPTENREAALVDLVQHLVPENLPPMLEVLAAGPAPAKALVQAWVKSGVETAPLRAALEGLGPEARSRAWAAWHQVAARQGGGADELGSAIGAALEAEAPLELLRSLAQSAGRPDELVALHAVASRLAAGDAVRLLATLGGKADRLGQPAWAAAWFGEGEALAASLPEDDPARHNLAAGRARLEGVPAVVPPPPAAPPAARGVHPILVLYNAYDGGLKAAHLQALARAAPLAEGFGLDLALVGFPTPGLAELVQHAEQESRIARGASLPSRLMAAGRLLWVPEADRAHAERWGLPARLVALHDRPAPGKECNLAAEMARGRVALVMGLGPRGLPPRLLAALPLHLELTGRNVPLETATVMGIVAERLRALQAS
ncbi:MAG: DUF531 family protein [Thermoplasmatota archaeon]